MSELEPRQERIWCSLTESEYRAFKHASVDSSTTMTRYLRKLVLAELRRLKEESKKPISSSCVQP